MKKVSCFAACVLFLFLWIPLAGAGTTKAPAPQGQASAEFGKIVRPKAGISWKEKVMMQREIQKKAAARRNALLRQAAIERQKIPKVVPPESQMEP